MRSRDILGFNLLATATLLSTTALAQTWTDFQVDNVTRQALVYVPSGIDHPPRLSSLHGLGSGAGWKQAEMMKFEPIADRKEFIVVYPEADQNLQWNLGGTHDIDFVLKIIDDMAAQYDIDPAVQLTRQAVLLDGADSCLPWALSSRGFAGAPRSPDEADATTAS